MENLLHEWELFFTLIKTNIQLTASIIGALWLIHFLNVILGHRLNILGIYPRHIFGLFGIPFFSFLHADFNHLLFNSIPLFVLINFMLVSGEQKFLHITATIIAISGGAIWLFGRRAIHIGASCLIMGYWSYLLVNAYQHPSVLSVMLAILCFYYFGGLLLSLFPAEEKVSWEGHVFGFIAGLVTLYWVPL